MLTNYIEVDIDKIISNLEKIKAKSKETKICAVIKANAYGLGSVPIAKNIEDHVAYFAVAKFEEAKVLRLGGIKKPILILGYVSLDEVRECVKYDIDIPIYDLNFSRQIDKILDQHVNAHLAIDTGQARIGFRPFEIGSIKKLKDLKMINIRGIFSHFATADEEDDSFTKEQDKKFRDLINKLKGDFTFDLAHISNSAGFIRQKIGYDMARIGISLYGIYPSEYLRNRKDIDLDLAFQFKSIVSFVKEIEPGTSVSYGRSFIANKKMKIATIPVGYADGYFRDFSNIGDVLVNGKKSRVCGRVCMDQMMVDVSGIDVKIGDQVIIYDDIYDQAKKIGTIPYELMTAFNMRLGRIYKRNGKIIEIDDYLGEIYEN
ncbi:MAG: alanine racemase [Tissierellia bacterium]|nr:alanine racemase [Tissierellia bacterium]